MINRVAFELFGLNEQDLLARADMPAGYDTGAQVGMMDFAFYSNQRAGQAPPAQGASTEEVNCVPHYDPGLWSISFFSSAEGLQLFDPVDNKWFAGPINTLQGQRNLGVLWLGEAAAKISQRKLKAGVHRVIFPAQEVKRLTMWYEACTIAQVNGPKDTPLPEGKLQIPNIVGTNNDFPIEEGESEIVVLRRVELDLGLPMSKSEAYIERGGSLSDLLANTDEMNENDNDI